MMKTTIQSDAGPRTHTGTSITERGRHGRILICDDRPEVQGLLSLLVNPGGFTVCVVDHLSDAVAALSSGDWDVLFVNPGGSVSRASLIRHALSTNPSIAIAVLESRERSGDGDVDPDVVPMSLDATDLELLLGTSRLVDAARHSRRAMPEVVLAIGAHPDDVEIGVGGTLLAHRAAGHSINILTLSRGARGGHASHRELEAQDAAEILGARLFIEDLEDTRIPEGHPTVELIERVIDIVRPTTLYTHSMNDTHQDHRATHKAALVAGRKIERFSCFQAPSSTIDFRPNRFVPIEGFLETKQAAIAAFKSQTGKCDYLRPEVIDSTSRYWARFADGAHAEAFEVVRDSTALAVHPPANRSFGAY
jgi:LmbE family N-acetylglucosaminyl deacetylase